MANESLSDIKDVVTVTSSILGEPCKHCGPFGAEGFAALITHYIQEHGYRLIHVGQQTEEGSDGPWQATVAVLGRPPEPQYQMHVLGGRR
jgi:hypothetical protein